MAATSNPSTFVCAFHSLNDAQHAIQDLVNAGVPREDISLVAGDSKGEYSQAVPKTDDVKKTSDGTTVGQNVAVGTGVGALGGLLLGLGALAIPGIGPVIAAGPLAAALGGAVAGAAGGGVIGVLKDAGVPDEDAKFYGETIQNGGALVTVHADASEEHRIDSILSRYKAGEVGERDLPVSGTAHDLRGTTGTRANVPAQTVDTGERTIPVVEEELTVGKRQVQGGGVRVYSRIVEKPVQEQVTLREEHVTVERRPVNRPISQGDVEALRGQTIELTETAEEAVVSKQARVVEEVVVGKDATERTETVRDTVRRTDVQVENLTGTEATTAYDTDFRNDFQTRFGTVKGATYESYAPAYQYGYRMASGTQYQGKNWNDVESTMKTDYLRSNPGSTWDNVKGAVRYGWEKVTGQR